MRDVTVPAGTGEAAAGDPGRDGLVERIAALIPGPPSNRIPDWPPDEQEYARNGDWLSFTDRERGLYRLRAAKLARQIADLVEDRPPTTWAYERACEALKKHQQRADTAEGERDQAFAEVKRVRQAAAATGNRVERTLGAALGYPVDGCGQVAVGDHVPESLALEAAERIAGLGAEVERLRAGLNRVTAWLDEMQVDGMQSVDDIIAEALAAEGGFGGGRGGEVHSGP